MSLSLNNFYHSFQQTPLLGSNIFEVPSAIISLIFCTKVIESKLISKYFIGDDIRLDPVMLDKQTTIEELLLFYMGKNTPDRQKFIINNLKVELDYAEETIELAQ